jgi:hypothetical protein
VSETVRSSVRRIYPQLRLFAFNCQVPFLSCTSSCRTSFGIIWLGWVKVSEKKYLGYVFWMISKRTKHPSGSGDLSVPRHRTVFIRPSENERVCGWKDKVRTIKIKHKINVRIHIMLLPLGGIYTQSPTNQENAAITLRSTGIHDWRDDFINYVHHASMESSNLDSAHESYQIWDEE